jgi:hypothetical protein
MRRCIGRPPEKTDVNHGEYRMKRVVLIPLTIASTLCLGAVQAEDAAQKGFQLGIMKC